MSINKVWEKEHEQSRGEDRPFATPVFLFKKKTSFQYPKPFISHKNLLGIRWSIQKSIHVNARFFENAEISILFQNFFLLPQCYTRAKCLGLWKIISGWKVDPKVEETCKNCNIKKFPSIKKGKERELSPKIAVFHCIYCDVIFIILERPAKWNKYYDIVHLWDQLFMNQKEETALS